MRILLIKSYFRAQERVPVWAQATRAAWTVPCIRETVEIEARKMPGQIRVICLFLFSFPGTPWFPPTTPIAPEHLWIYVPSSYERRVPEVFATMQSCSDGPNGMPLAKLCSQSRWEKTDYGLRASGTWGSLVSFYQIWALFWGLGKRWGCRTWTPHTWEITPRLSQH